MQKRYPALDILRGLTIFGMIFCATIPYGVLPAWMYHIQTPPPSHAVDLTLTGLSWVDLVFPVFIFCMGVAIPMSGRNKLDRYFSETAERFVMLWLFSYLYVFLNFGSVDSIWAQVLTVVGFLSLFPLYFVYKESNKKRVYKSLGLLAVIIVIAVGHFAFGEVISLDRRGIIIFLLAFLYLFASIIWYFTRESIKRRWIVFGAITLFSAISMYFDLAQKAYSIESIRWIFNLEYILFLMILIPATIIGDMLLADKEKNNGFLQPDKRLIINHLFFPLLVVFTGWLCYAFYMKLFILNLGVSTVFLFVFYLMINKYYPQYKKMFTIVALFTVIGILTDYIEGGIQKSPCTMSYCFITLSISVVLLWFAEYIALYLPKSYITRIFSGSGSNPLMSYIAFNSFLIPVFKITGLIVIYKAAFPAELPWLGVVSAAVFVLFMMALVAVLSERKIYWKA